MNTNLDEKALGVLFFFTPLLALPFFKKFPRPLQWILLGLLVVSRGLAPYLTTANRMVASGIATGASFSMLFLLLSSIPQVRRWGGAGLALAVGLSALLRAAGEGIEYSLTPAGGWAGWVLGILLVGVLLLLKVDREPVTQRKRGGRTAPVLGIYLILTLVYFSFSAPAVIARWTEGDYTLIVSAVSLFSLAWTWLLIRQPRWIERLSPQLAGAVEPALYPQPDRHAAGAPGLVPAHCRLPRGGGRRADLAAACPAGFDAAALPGVIPRPAGLPPAPAALHSSLQSEGDTPSGICQQGLRGLGLASFWALSS